eukprot:5595359-Prymnesium_polylepis.1
MGGALGAQGDDGPGRCAGAAAGRRAVVRRASWLPAAPTDVCSSFEENRHGASNDEVGANQQQSRPNVGVRGRHAWRSGGGL